MSKFRVLEQKIIDGEMWYSVYVSDEVGWWLFNTFNHSVDYKECNHVKGTWVDMPGRTLALLKLRWS